MKFKAEMGHWSGIVGNSVHLIGEDGRFLGQIAIMCQDDRLREKDVQTELCEKICTALNADLCASGKRVRAVLEGAVNWLDALLTLVQETSCDPDDPEAFDEVVMAAGMWLSSARADLTPAPTTEE